MIRTHEAGTLRADARRRRPSRSPAGSPAAATTAAWPSSTCATRPASSRWSSATRRSPHGLRNEFCLRVVGEVSAAAGGQREPGPADRRRSRSSPTEVEVLNEAAPLPFQIDEHVEVGEEVRLRYRYLDLRRAGAGARRIRLRSEVNRAAREVLHGRDFVEIETPDADPLDPRGRPRLPGAGAAAARAAGTRCRSRRSCSSSC